MRIPFLLLIIFIIKGCKSNTKEPTDNQMINHFYKYKSDFEMIRQLISEDTITIPGFHYPPILFQGKYKNSNDSIYSTQLSIHKKEKLNSLLQNIKCNEIFVLSHNEITFYYYSHGGIGWGIDKNFVYRNKNFHQMSDVKICPKEIDMAEKCYKTMDNCHFVKEIGNNWYIELIYDR